MPARDGIEIATMYVGYYGIQPKAPDESNADFRARVAGVLRRESKVIDAHEVFANCYHDEERPEDAGLGNPASLGALGHVALALNQPSDRAPMNETGNARVDMETDQIAGLSLQHSKRYDPGMANAMLLLVAAMSGR